MRCLRPSPSSCSTPSRLRGSSTPCSRRPPRVSALTQSCIPLLIAIVSSQWTRTSQAPIFPRPRRRRRGRQLRVTATARTGCASWRPLAHTSLGCDRPSSSRRRFLLLKLTRAALLVRSTQTGLYPFSPPNHLLSSVAPFLTLLPLSEPPTPLILLPAPRPTLATLRRLAGVLRDEIGEAAAWDEARFVKGGRKNRWGRKEVDAGSMYM
jgi:hypothetical protein